MKVKKEQVYSNNRPGTSIKKRLQPNTTHYIGEYNKIQCITKHTTVNYKGIIGAPTTSLKSSSPDGSGKSSNKG